MFVEAQIDGFDNQFRSRLSFIGSPLSGYTHVLLGCDESYKYKFDSLLTLAKGNFTHKTNDLLVNYNTKQILINLN